MVIVWIQGEVANAIRSQNLFVWQKKIAEKGVKLIFMDFGSILFLWSFAIGYIHP